MKRTDSGAFRDGTCSTTYKDGDGYGDGEFIYTGFLDDGDGEFRPSSAANPQLDYEDYEQVSQ